MVSVQNFIVLCFNRTYFFISPTSDGDVNTDIQIVYKSLLCLWCVEISYLLLFVTITSLLYNKSCMLLYGHICLYTMKVMAVEEV